MIRRPDDREKRDRKGRRYMNKSDAPVDDIPQESLQDGDNPVTERLTLLDRVVEGGRVAGQAIAGGFTAFGRWIQRGFRRYDAFFQSLWKSNDEDVDGITGQVNVNDDELTSIDEEDTGVFPPIYGQPKHHDVRDTEIVYDRKPKSAHHAGVKKKGPDYRYRVEDDEDMDTMRIPRDGSDPLMEDDSTKLAQPWYKKFLRDERDAFGNAKDHPHVPLFKPRVRNRSFLVSTILSMVMVFVLLAAVVGVSGLGAVLGIINAYVDTTPVLDLAKIENLAETSFIYDDENNLITTYSGLENRIYASIDEIPMLLQTAFVATEDARFYTHNGIDLKRIFGAFFSNLRTDTTQGGSTITQQLIKLRLLSYEQTYKRKLQEAYLAIQLEQQYNKDQILEAYLNTIDLGSGNYGVKAAAKDYFGKELNQLSLRECAMLAGVANSPYLFNPRSNYYLWDKPDRVENRTNIVLRRMYQGGYITLEEYEAGLQEKVMVREESEKKKMYDMPYFLEYAIVDVVEHMLRSRNMTISSTNKSLIENELRTKGYHIYTTVDRDLQHIVENTLYNWDRYPLTQYESDAIVMVKNSDGTSQEIIQPQAAATVFDFQTGELKAIVGGRHEPLVRKGLNRAYQSYMPVGSSIKPLAVYGPALNGQMAPANVVLDLPIPIDGWRSERGYPNNYSGKFSGPVTMRYALKKSINMAAVKILIDEVGFDESYNTLINLGIDPDHLNKDAAGLALGTSGITTVDMAVAFGAIGNNGEYIEPIAFTQVTDSRGNIILDATASRIERQVFTPAASWLLVDMLTEAVNYGTGPKAKIPNMTVAGKTGTNSGYKGVYFSGMTPYYSAAVWIGHDQYEPLDRSATGGSYAAPLWQSFMEQIHDVKELENDRILDTTPKELGLTRATVCSVSGLLATDACHQDAAGRTPVTDYFFAGTVPTETCDQHVSFHKCNDTGQIATPYCPNKVQQSYVLIPRESPVNQLEHPEFVKYYPNGLRNLPPFSNIGEFNYNNPAYSIHFCPIHTQQWYDNAQMMTEAVNGANTLLGAVDALMNEHGHRLSGDQKTQINAARMRLNDLKNARNDYNAINEAANSLRVLKESYLDPWIGYEDPEEPDEPEDPDTPQG